MGGVGARRWPVQVVRFAVVGLVNTATDLAVLNAETLLTGMREGAGYAVEKWISFCAAVAVSFVLNKRWTFEDRSAAARGRKLSRFFAVSVLGALINVGTATAVVTWVRPLLAPAVGSAVLADQVWVNLGALSGTAAGFCWNFLGYKLVVFR